MKRLPPLVNYYEVPHKEFTHMDFVIARDVKKLVYNEIVRVMKMYDWKHMVKQPLEERALLYINFFFLIKR